MIYAKLGFIASKITPALQADDTIEFALHYIKQLNFLEEFGCDIYQGYYKSKPVPVKEFEKLFNL
jgi:hypothetical protein